MPEVPTKFVTYRHRECGSRVHFESSYRHPWVWTAICNECDKSLQGSNVEAVEIDLQSAN